MPMWMIRGDAGRLYDEFRERHLVAIGWPQIAALAVQNVSRDKLIQAYRTADPSIKEKSAISGASQVFRFVQEIKPGDRVVTYSPATRMYLVGSVEGGIEYHPEWDDLGMSLTRATVWAPEEIRRDELGLASKNSLGSTLTVFRVPDHATAELEAQLSGESRRAEPEALDIEEQIDDPLSKLEAVAFERIKDEINALDWDEMQELVAGILRAMSYRTQISPAGSDRGKDIVASPDGLGLQQPRIVVEVKHRDGRMGSKEIRSFVGGRHKDDRGLFISTGGFTKDALYEAERASIPIMLWSIDDVARALMAYYPQTDAKVKRLLPLKYFYVPA